MDWYPWHYIIYERNTMHLTPYQDGCYRRLIDHYMKTRAALPDNDIVLARIVGDTLENWNTLARDDVRPFFKAIDKTLVHKFCDEILNEQDIRAKDRSKSAKIAAKTRWRKNKEKQEVVCDTHADGMRDACETHARPMRNDAIGQDITLQDKTVSNLDKHPDIKKTLVGRVLKKPAPKKRGSRISEDWTLTQDLGDWAELQGLQGLEIVREAEKFKNYWLAKTGANATKLDWDATWRNWILNKMDGKNGR